MNDKVPRPKQKCESFSTFSRFYLVLDLKHLPRFSCFSPTPPQRDTPNDQDVFWGIFWAQHLVRWRELSWTPHWDILSGVRYCREGQWRRLEGSHSVGTRKDEEFLQLLSIILWCSTSLRKEDDCLRLISGYSDCCLQLGTGRWGGLMFGFLWLISPGPFLTHGIASYKREMKFLVSSPWKDQATLSCFHWQIYSDQSIKLFQGEMTQSRTGPWEDVAFCQIHDSVRNPGNQRQY